MNINDYQQGDEQEKFRRKLAKWLGITYDELEEFGEEVEPNNGEPGKAKFAYFLQFSNSTDQEILDKIKRVDNNNAVYFNLEELDQLY